MPQRPNSHVIGERATARVSQILVDAGHAVEVVINDYGDDLLVQTSHVGQMDASRLWFQVKGTDSIANYQLQSGDFRLSVPYDHAVRWSRSLDLVVVVLCDVKTGDVRYALPRDQLDSWAGNNGLPKSITLHTASRTPRRRPSCASSGS